MAKQNVLPPVLVVKRQNFERVFNEILKTLISKNKIEITELTELNKELAQWLVTGMNNVDFNNYNNKVALDNLVNDVWIDFYRILNLKIKKHRLKFLRRTI